MFRVILSASAMWEGGKPWESTKFELNARRLGLQIYDDPSVKNNIGQYVILDKDCLFYHATKPEYVDSILQQGLLCHSRDGKQANGVYLTGGPKDLNMWFGDETVILEVKILKGTRIYEDMQPNAVYVTEDIPASRIKQIN